MNRRLVTAAFLLLGAVACSDIHYLRKADSAYESAVIRHDAQCVKVKHVKDRAEYDFCEKEKAELKATKLELDAANGALIKGPLTKGDRERLKRIRAKWSQ